MEDQRWGGRYDAKSRGRRDVLAAAVLWSLGGVFAKSLPFDGLTLAFYRGLFAGLVLLPMVPRRRWSFQVRLIPLGLVFGLMTGLYLGAVKATTAANAIFLQCTSALWTVPLSALLLRERPDRRAVLGIVLATVGVLAIVSYGYDGRDGEGTGILLGLASGVGYAAVTVGFRGCRDLDPTWLSAASNLAGSLALGAGIVATRGAIPRLDLGGTVSLIAFGAIQMAIPYILFARGLRSIEASEAALLALLEPILSPIWVVLFTGERPAPATLVGGAFLLLGVGCRYWPEATKEGGGGPPHPLEPD